MAGFGPDLQYTLYMQCAMHPIGWIDQSKRTNNDLVRFGLGWLGGVNSGQARCIVDLSLVPCLYVKAVV